MVKVNQCIKGLIHDQYRPLVSPVQWTLHIVRRTIGCHSFRGTQYGKGLMVGSENNASSELKCDMGLRWDVSLTQAGV
jgi:hypothetical protein